MNIGEAIEMLRQGQRVCRPGWNGKGMWLQLVLATPTTRAFIEMSDAQGMLVPWLASQTDLLASDWQLVS